MMRYYETGINGQMVPGEKEMRSISWFVGFSVTFPMTIYLAGLLLNPQIGKGYAYFLHHWVPGVLYIVHSQQILVGKVNE